MNVCICGTVKNCGKYLVKVLENMEKIGSVFEDYQIVIYYDTSTDNTLEILNNYNSKNKKLMVYVNKNLMSPFRTHNLSIARNFCLNYVMQNKSHFPYFIMMDCDDVNCKEINTDILKKYLDIDTWDALSFNTTPKYYDIWALSIYPYCFSYNHFENNVKYYYIIQNYIDVLLKKVKKENKLLKCISAFNGFSLYRTDKFINSSYDGTIRLDLIPKKFIDFHKKATGTKKMVFKKYETVDGQFEDCEHRAFHIQAIHKNNARIMISPDVLFYNMNTYIETYFENKLKTDKKYTQVQAENDIKQRLKDIFISKLLKFNKNIEYNYDLNGIPKLIHFTCKDKQNINNSVWKDCLNKYYTLYPDYKIIIYDDADIYEIVEIFRKKHVDCIKKITLGAVKADIFRYLILYLRGGYYSDMDCFPYKRIEELSKVQYHGDEQNIINIFPKNSKLHNPCCDFTSNPCCNYLNIYNGLNKKICKCLGHKYITNTTNIIVGYEFEKTWNSNIINSNTKHLWTDNNYGICQWFIGAKPQEKLFLTCFKKSISNISKININDKKNIHFNVINSTGPLFFTKVINEFLSENKNNFKERLAILPCDFFCCGSGTTVPSTKNKFLQHQFTGTWLK